MANVEFNMISKEPRVSRTIDSQGNEKVITTMTPTATTTYQLQADADAMQALGGALFTPPKEALFLGVTGDHLGGAGAATATLAAAGHGLLGETVQQFVHTLMGVKK